MQIYIYLLTLCVYKIHKFIKVQQKSEVFIQIRLF